MKKYLILIAFVCILINSAFASDGVLFQVDVHQIDKSANEKVLVYSDSFDIVVGKSITGFVGPFSLDIDLLEADTIRSTFNTHIITLGTSAKTYSKSFAVEYELPARIEQIEGKNKSEYTISISPRKLHSDVEINCKYDHRSKDDFSVLPTAHTEQYYIPFTLGEFYWDAVKELMESNYVLFRNFVNHNLPGKIHIYVSPCAMNSVIWDKRFGTSVDPTKSTAFAIFNKDFTTVDPFIINQAITLKTYGYSSPFLSEGLANYFSFAIFDMKKILQENKNIPLEKILGTHAYLTADASIADRISTTFTRYLIDTYSLTKFFEVYKKADDINLAITLENLYEKPIAELEQEWLNYVDTSTIPLQAYLTYAKASELVMNYDLMHTYYLAHFENARTSNDSLRAYTNLKRSSFFKGNYYQAAEYQQKLMDIMPVNKAINLMVLGSYSLMVGDDEKAFTSFTESLEMDSSNHLTKFNLAIYYLQHDSLQKAKEILLSNFSTVKGSSAQGETRIILADILSKSDKELDHQSALKYYTEASNYFKRQSQANSSSPSSYMWLGASYYGLEDYQKAIDNLSIARYIESRPFYIGMIDVMLAKAYIGSRDKKLAEQHLLAVLASASSVYHQKEANKLLEQLK